MLMCRDLVKQADAYLAGDLPRMRRWMILMHLFMCRHCRRFMRQFELLLQVLPRLRKQADERTVESVMAAIRADAEQDDDKPA